MHVIPKPFGTICRKPLKARWVLVTSRNQNWRSFCSNPVEITIWSRNESVAFVQKRTGLNDETAADALAKTLGDLTLALEQAAAYIETSKITIPAYLKLYNNRRPELWQHESGPHGHKQTVATTFGLSLDEIEKKAPLGVLFLNLCAVAAPEGIPVTLITACGNVPEIEGNELLDDLAFNKAAGVFGTYSLVRFEGGTCSLHRLVQSVACDRMGEKKTTLYRDVMVKTVSELFPDEGYRNPACWPECEPLTPHAETLAEATADDSDAWQELARFLNSVGSYHHGRAAYAEAETMFCRALAIREKQLDPNHPEVAASLNNLALLFDNQGKNSEAEPLYRRALAIDEKALGKEHPGLAIDLNNLAGLFYLQGKFAEAEPLYRRALAIDEKSLGKDHPQTKIHRNNLNGLIKKMNNQNNQ